MNRLVSSPFCLITIATCIGKECVEISSVDFFSQSRIQRIPGEAASTKMMAAFQDQLRRAIRDLLAIIILWLVLDGILILWSTQKIIAKIIAKEGGPKLGQFIIDLKNHCIELEHPNLKIHLICHSMDARILLSALDSINRNDIWRTSNFNISTVNLLEGAVDNYELL